MCFKNKFGTQILNYQFTFSFNLFAIVCLLFYESFFCNQSKRGVLIYVLFRFLDLNSEKFVIQIFVFGLFSK